MNLIRTNIGNLESLYENIVELITDLNAEPVKTRRKRDHSEYSKRYLALPQKETFGALSIILIH